jgi:hypothetical protein
METPKNELRVFTASQIAKRRGVSRQLIHQLMAGIEPAGLVMTPGGLAKAWAVKDLPETLLQALREIVVLRGYRDIEHALSDADPARLWNPGLPLSDLSPGEIQEAQNLMKAQARALELRNNPDVSRAAWASIAMQDYKEAFGCRVSERHALDLVQRTIERAGPQADFSDLRLYIPKRAVKKNRSAKQPGANSDAALNFPELDAVLLGVRDRAMLSDIETARLWLEVCRVFKNSAQPKKAKRQLLNYLWANVPTLSVSTDALRKLFDRTYSAWLAANESPDALVDGRTEKRGLPVKPKLDEKEVRAIQYARVNITGGRTAQAVRVCDELGLIKDERLRNSIDNRTSKSYTLPALREELGNCDALRVCHIGRADKLSPTVSLTYDGIYSMDCVTGDDLTAPVYFYVSDGQGWYNMTRGQTIILCDFRTLRILAHALRPFGQYDALTVRTAFKTAFEAHGLPKFIYREGGIWRNSHLVNSLGVSSKNAAFSESEIEFELEKKGVRFRTKIDDLCHDLSSLSIKFREAYRPNAKPIERVCGMVQDLMEGEPGYCGRNEREDCPLQVRKNLELVKNKKANPWDLGFYSFNQWMERQHEIFKKYNAERQEGKRLRHPITGQPLSPDEAFEVFKDREDPKPRFDESCRYLLSHMRFDVKVKAPNARGRQFPSGFVCIRDHVYCDSQFADKLGQTLLAFWDPEAPETCTFTDRNMKNPFTVKRLESTNALYLDEAGKQTLKQARSVVSAIKTEYRSLQDEFGPVFRRNLVSRPTVEVGEEIKRANSGVKSEQRKDDARWREICSLAQLTGTRKESCQNDEQTLKGLRLMAAAFTDVDLIQGEE